MKLGHILSAFIFLAGSHTALAENLDNVKPNQIISVTLSQLHPTQPSVGYDEIYYKLGRFSHEPKKLYDTLCEINGEKGIAHFYEHSKPTDASSYKCKEPVGTERDDMKTAVIGPDAKLYLTDGHHTFVSLWQLPEAGKDLKVHVIITKDYRSESTTDFWQNMIMDNNAWLFNRYHNPISWHQLPTDLELSKFDDDRYRSFMYFSRGISWDKPNPAMPYIEFYWATAVRTVFDLNQYDLNTQQGYLKALAEGGDAIIRLRSPNLGGSGKNAVDLGQYPKVSKKGLKHLQKRFSKLSYMIEYKQQLSK
ncbi:MULTISPECIES: ParB/Srx family N-terminal domain-containing protein [Vibrio]|nr:MULTISPECIES: ParB/Srx family N-terminal domain-containing protein [Vibrio]MBF9000137.1 ParB/Srx family N-terminal domain-containing protein [Vibrio nitrifigilis]